jgi:hypothetical protein
MCRFAYHPSFKEYRRSDPDGTPLHPSIGACFRKEDEECYFQPA